MNIRNAALIASLLTACNKGTVSGQVVDRDGKPVSGVQVSVLGKTAKTNGKGRFKIDKISDMPEKRVVVNFRKDGFFDFEGGSRVTDGSTYVKVALTKREVVETIDAEAGSSVTYGGLTMSIPPGAWVRPSDGTRASGSVNLFVGTMVPGENDDFAEAMPGRDFATLQGGEGVLASAGAFVIEAEDENGDPVEIEDPVEICLDIPDSLMGVAPEEMPLWQEQSGSWVEVGMATRRGDQYCFALYESGSLNCDLFSRVAVVEGTVCQNGEPVGEGTEVRLFQNVVHTDANGVYGAMVPACYNFVARVGKRQREVPGIPAGMTRIVDFNCGDGPSGGLDTGLIPSIGPSDDTDPFATGTGGSGQNNSGGSRDNDPWANTATTKTAGSHHNHNHSHEPLQLDRPTVLSEARPRPSASSTVAEQGTSVAQASAQEEQSWSDWAWSQTVSGGTSLARMLVPGLAPPPNGVADSGNGGDSGQSGWDSGSSQDTSGSTGQTRDGTGVAGPDDICDSGSNPFIQSAAFFSTLRYPTCDSETLPSCSGESPYCCGFLDADRSCMTGAHCDPIPCFNYGEEDCPF